MPIVHLFGPIAHMSLDSKLRGPEEGRIPFHVAGATQQNDVPMCQGKIQMTA